MADFIDEVSDSVALSDELHVAFNGELRPDELVDVVGVVDVVLSELDGSRLESDTVTVTDDVTASIEIFAAANDSIDVTDDIVAFATRETVVVMNDTIGVTDSVTLQLSGASALFDSIVVTEALGVERELERQISDTANVTDSFVAGTTIAFLIDSIVAVSSTRVHIAFQAPALINDALSRASSYVFDNVSAGSVEVVPLSVSLPTGQSQPLFVEIETTEHTNAATYEVALTEGIRGASGEIGHTIPVQYTGLGIAPTLRLALATSPTEVQVHFSEAITNNAAANDRTKYLWSGGISTVQVKSVIGNVVTLQTTAQLPGALYTLTVKGPSTYSAGLDLDELDVDDTVLVECDYALTLDQDELVVADEVAVSIESAFAATDSISVTDSIVALKISSLALPAFFASSRISPPTSPELQRSTDGVNWVSTNYSPAPNKVVRNGARNVVTGTIILIGDDGLFLRSTDEGLTWSLLTPWSATADAGALWYGDGKWIVNYSDGSGATGIRYSIDDGLTWSALIDPDSGTGTGHSGTASAGFSDIMYDGIYAASQHVGVGYRGNIWTSPDAITWTRRTPAAAYVGSFYGFRGVSYAPALGLYCAVGDPNEIQTSPDGIAWTHRTADATVTRFWDVCWSPTLAMFCAVGGGASGTPKISTSLDGVTWTVQNPGGTPADLYSCSWDSVHAKFIVAGRFGRVLTSPDGVNWTYTPPANTGGTFVGNSASSTSLLVGNGQGQ